VKPLLNAAHEVIKDPASEAPKKKLAMSVGDFRAGVQAVSDAIRNAPPPVFGTTPPEVLNFYFTHRIIRRNIIMCHYSAKIVINCFYRQKN
jgi:hypothetical protein